MSRLDATRSAILRATSIEAVRHLALDLLDELVQAERQAQAPPVEVPFPRAWGLLPGEANALRALLAHHEPLSAEAFAPLIWVHREPPAALTFSVDRIMWGLRKKLTAAGIDQPIETHYAIGKVLRPAARAAIEAALEAELAAIQTTATRVRALQADLAATLD